MRNLGRRTLVAERRNSDLEGGHAPGIGIEVGGEIESGDIAIKPIEGEGVPRTMLLRRPPSLSR